MRPLSFDKHGILLVQLSRRNMARENVIAITSAEARLTGEKAIENGEDKKEVARQVFKAAKAGMFAPSDDEAFAAGVAILWELYPDDENLRQETRAIGDRAKMLNALVSGVPVDLEGWEPTPMPDDCIGLIEIWRDQV
jgi:hypothetical protein